MDIIIRANEIKSDSINAAIRELESKLFEPRIHYISYHNGHSKYDTIEGIASHIVYTHRDFIFNVKL